MNLTVSYVLDTGALLSYAHRDSLIVGAALSDVVTRDRHLAVSPVAMLEAWLELDAESDAGRILDLLVSHRAVFTAPLATRADVAAAAGFGAGAGPLPAAVVHAAFLARHWLAGILTDRPDPYRHLLGDDWPILEL